MRHITKKSLCLLFSFYASFSLAQVDVQDSLELIQFYNDVCNGCPLEWDFSQPVETWEGIQEIENGRIIEIYVDELDLNGTLADWNFPFLERLHVDENQLTGIIPDFSNMPLLKRIRLFENDFSGNIPDFSNLTNLISFEAQDNQLIGTLPDFSNLPNLERLDLENNNLTGTLPDFSNLPNLERLDLEDNNLTGTLLDFSNLPNLEHLDLEDNNFEGNVPNFSQLSNLQFLDLSLNALVGTIPDFQFLSMLEYLNLSSNELVGNIHDFNLHELTRLYLASNELEGEIPLFINIPNLENLDLRSNNLSGSIPQFTQQSLEEILLKSNQLSGTLPDFTYLPNIEEIDLSSNLLIGCIPTAYSEFCTSDYEIDFSDNIDLPNNGDFDLFCTNGLGTCDTSIESDSLELVFFHENACTNCSFWNLNQPISTWQGVILENGRVVELSLPNMNIQGILHDFNLSELRLLNLGDNYLTGDLPTFGLLSHLEELLMPNNLFDSSLPDYNLPNLKILDLSNNQLQDDLPQFTNLINLESIFLFSNDLSGAIPDYQLTNLETLRLGNNNISGNIPNFTQSSSLSEVHLNDNNLTGGIPLFINQPDLQSLYLQNNQLSGTCYPLQITHFCNVDYNFTGNADLPGGGDFLSFCNNGTYQCEDNSVPVADSLELVNFYLQTCNDDCSLNWEFTFPVFTWFGVSVDEGKITELVITNAGLSGNMPDLQLPDLEYLNLEGNELIGQIPNFTVLPQLRTLSFGGYNWTILGDFNSVFNGNLFTGYIPNFSSCPLLESLHLANNQLEGSIPNFSLSELSIINLGDNRLSGTLPSFSQLNDLIFLDLEDNLIEGMIPDYSVFQGLIVLDLSGNGLEGEIPNFSLPNLVRLELRENQLIGEISNFNLPNLKLLDVRWNKLSGTIPNFTQMPKIEGLYMNDNQFNGSIPNFSACPLIFRIELGRNNLEGSIPQFNNLDSLEFLSLFSNRLSGTLPLFENNLNLERISIQNNGIEGGIPDYSHLVNLGNLLIQNNYFTFDNIEAYLSTNAFSDFRYSPQYHGDVQSISVSIGDTLGITLSSPLPGNNNENVAYQWKQNDLDKDGFTNDTYSIIGLNLPDVGKYTLHMTDPSRVADLEIISEPIYVITPGYDLLGEPVEYNQLIIEFDDWQDKVNYETEQLFPNAAVLADSCSCNRLLYLWEFPNDSIAFQILLDIDTKKQAQTADADVDGGFNNILGIGPIPGTQGWTWTGEYPHSYPDSVSIFLLDSGMDTQNWDATPYLTDTAPIDDCYGVTPYSGYDYADPLTAVLPGFVDSIGHGTFGMRSIAEGADQYMNMNVVPLKVFDNDGRGTLFNFICALYHAIDHDADIINVSAGYAGQPSDILEEAIALAHSKGQFIVTATGNEGINIDSFPQYPAYYAKPFARNVNGSDTLIHYTNVISVAALNVMDSLWQYSNYGSEAATISAYGENMGGYSHTGEDVSYSGTSLSTYYVTRQLAAEIARDKTRSFEDIWAAFEADYLRDCSATNGLTSTGKCLDISLREVYSDLRVFLEGPFDIAGDTMRTDLNALSFLPGQDSIFSHDAAVQPYDIAPFDYYGTESVPSTFNNYPSEVVDWVLISARTEVDPSSTVSLTAAWLLKDGRVQLLKPLFDELATAPDSVYIVIQHRNHIDIMSPQKLPVERNIVTWDFTTQDSYTIGTVGGQIVLNDLHWGMFAGDSTGDGAVTAADRTDIWNNRNGQSYMPQDCNMNGATTAADNNLSDNNTNTVRQFPQ